MIILAEGLTGAGKTILITRLALSDWRKGAEIYANYDLNFSDDHAGINRWHNLDEIFGVHNGVILIDDAVRLMDARRWQSLPVTFTEKIATHRHEHLDIYSTIQSINHIDLRVRSNVHILYSCRSLFRFPPNDRVLPFFQVIKAIEKHRVIDDKSRLRFAKKRNKYFFISRFWTKKLYNTFQEFKSSKYIWKIIYKDKRWKARAYARELVNRGKARI